MSWVFACPRCHAALISRTSDVLMCPADHLRFERLEGLWHFLLPERQTYYTRFITEYESVRRGEGRGSTIADYYRALPYRDLSGRLVADWRIRAASFDTFLNRVLRPFEKEQGRSLTVVDLGAGNGWLSHRLAQRGHAVAAVDITLNDFDGLGCHRFFDSAFTPLQAEFDFLPLRAESVDLVIFNASLHYAEDYLKTLSESLRVLTPAGVLVILDSPLYHDGQSGAQMVREREAGFAKRYGFLSNALPSQNYLTYDRLQELAAQLQMEWRQFTPNYGLGWQLKPFKAKLLKQREPAKFHVILGRVRR